MNIILFEKGVRHFEVKDERTLHLLKVLHASVGTEFISGEINGEKGKSVITSTSDGISFDFFPTCDGKELYPLTVIVALVRPICMKRILRELVSMGVGHIILSSSELGEKSYKDATLYKDGSYKSIMLSGAMQGGFTGVPTITFTSSVSDAIKESRGVCLLPDNVIGTKSFSSYNLEGKEVTLAIGSERGWSDKERSLFLNSGFSPVLMGKHILRTETASVAGCALALEAMGYI